MEWFTGKLQNLIRQTAVSIGIREPVFSFEKPDNESQIRDKLIGAAKAAGSYGQLDNVILNGDFLKLLKGERLLDGELIDLPIDQLEGLTLRLFSPPNTTWRDAVNGLHCRLWDERPDLILQEFEDGFYHLGSDVPGADGSPDVYLIGNVAYIAKGNHRIAAAKAWLAWKKHPFFRQIYTYIHRLHPEFNAFFRYCITNNCDVQFYFVPKIYPQTDKSNSKDDTEEQKNKDREDVINKSHRFLKKYYVEIIFKITAPDGNVSFRFISCESGKVKVCSTLLPRSLGNIAPNFVLKHILNRVPFSNFPHSLMNRLIRDPFVADWKVAANRHVPHPDCMLGDLFGRVPLINTAMSSYPAGNIYLQRGCDHSSKSIFGLEFIVRRFEKLIRTPDTTCVHSATIEFIAAILAPGTKIYAMKDKNFLKIVNQIGTAYLQIQKRGPTQFYTVNRISMRTRTQGNEIGSIMHA